MGVTPFAEWAPDLPDLAKRHGLEPAILERLVKAIGTKQFEAAGDAAGVGGGVAGAGSDGHAAALRADLELTLAALGYEPLEINRALRAVAQLGQAPAGDGEAWLRESLRWLSRSEAA